MNMYADEFLSKNTPQKMPLSEFKYYVHATKFSGNIEKSIQSPFSEVMLVTPSIAKMLLERNKDNRTINQQLIKTIANDITANRWKLNGESIIISKEGDLNDGQHRLLAVILADKPIETLVFFGAERESRMTVDMGKARTVANLLSMDNVQNSNHVAAIARMYFLYRANRYQDGGSSVTSTTKQQLRQEYFNHQEKIEKSLQNVGHQKFSYLIGLTPICTAYIAIGDVNTENREEFFSKLLSGENLRTGNPILKAREHLMDMRTKRTTAQQRIEAIFRYWNLWRRGATASRACSIYNEWPELES